MKVNNAVVATAAFAGVSQANIFEVLFPFLAGNNAHVAGVSPASHAAANHTTATTSTQPVAVASSADFADLSAFLANALTQAIHGASKSIDAAVRPTDDKPDAAAASQAAAIADADDGLPSEEEIDKLIASADAKQQDGKLPVPSALRRRQAPADPAAAAAGADGFSESDIADIMAAMTAAAKSAGVTIPTNMPIAPGSGAADSPAAPAEPAPVPGSEAPVSPGADTPAPAGQEQPAFPGADTPLPDSTAAVVPGVATPTNIVYGGGNGTVNDQQVWLAAAPRTAIGGLAVAGIVAAYLL